MRATNKHWLNKVTAIKKSKAAVTNFYQKQIYEKKTYENF